MDTSTPSRVNALTLYVRMTLWTLGGITLLAMPARAVESGSPGDEIAVIESESRCVDTAGIAIDTVPENQVKVACLTDQNVRNECNTDGQHARVKAFKQWIIALVSFQNQCTQTGGTFAFADPNFKEPANDTFCSLAEPEVTYTSLEDPLCNFVSRCPRVQVFCRQIDSSNTPDSHAVLLPGIPKALALAY